MGAIANAKLGCSLLDVASYGLFSQFESVSDLSDALPNGLATQHRQLSRREGRCPTDAVRIIAHKLLQANGGKVRPHEEHYPNLGCQTARQHFLRPVPNDPPSADRAHQAVAHAVFE